MTTEPTAIRHPRRGKAHRLVRDAGFIGTGCGRWGLYAWQWLPLSQTAPEDRCKTCWPPTEETS